VLNWGVKKLIIFNEIHLMMTSDKLRLRSGWTMKAGGKPEVLGPAPSSATASVARLASRHPTS
jgi:hypothetical protein